MATSNVRTVLIPGEIQEISKEMMKYKIDIIAKREKNQQDASCWFFLSLHTLLTMHGHRNLKILLRYKR